ncbi:MAG TPA: hypothetical protein VF790_06260 [Dissulfurispiraceae bacterium]
MTYIATIKEGMHTVHRNWQLILIQFASMFLSCVSFFIIVGVPIAIAFIMFGLDLTEILRFKDLMGAFRGSTELLNKYFGMALVVILSLFVYLAVIVVLWVFTIAGVIGVLEESISGRSPKFSLPTFFAEGKRLFVPVLAFSSIVGAAFLILAFILGLLGGGASTIIDMARAQEAALGLFLGFFFSLVLLSAGLALILITLSVTIYGIAYMVFNRAKPLESLKETARYLYERPSGVGFYSVLLAGYMVIGFIVILVGTPFALIPIIGSLLSIPYQLATYVIQGYVSLIMLASVFHYYYRTGYLPSHPQSTEETDISGQIEEGQAPPPEEKDENRQE